MTDTAVRRTQSNKREPRPDELLVTVEDHREQLAATIDMLLERTSPAALSGEAKRQVRDYFVAPDGEPRKESLVRVGIAAGCVLGGVAVFWLLRRKFHR